MARRKKIIFQGSAVACVRFNMAPLIRILIHRSLAVTMDAHLNMLLYNAILSIVWPWFVRTTTKVCTACHAYIHNDFDFSDKVNLKYHQHRLHVGLFYSAIGRTIVCFTYILAIYGIFVPSLMLIGLVFVDFLNHMVISITHPTADVGILYTYFVHLMKCETSQHAQLLVSPLSYAKRNCVLRDDPCTTSCHVWAA